MKMKRLVIPVFIGLFAFASFFIIKSIHDEKDIIDMDITFKGKAARSINGALEYYAMIKGDFKTGEIDPELVNQAYLQADKIHNYRAGLNLKWASRGPDNIGGRTRALLIDKDNSKVLIAGGVSGGIFKSTNGGVSWVRKSYLASAGGLIVSCITQSTDGAIYIGTGEGYFNAMSGPNGDLTSGSRGGGVYKSTDKGETWALLASTDPSTAGNTRWYNVQSIKADPANANTLYAATYSGLMKSTDAGNTWTRLDMPDGGTLQIFVDIVISNDGKTIFTSSYSAGRSKLFRSVNGAAFTTIASTVSQITNSTRLTLAIAPSNQNYIYVCAASNGTSPYPGVHSFGGLYRSTDNGDTWVQAVAGASEAEPFGRNGHYQGQYDNCVAVDPSNPNRAFIGGVSMYIYNNGAWYKGASDNEFLDADELYKNPYYIHPDMHNIIFDTKLSPKRMYIVTDGGIFMSENYTNNYPYYKELNLYYLTTQFYAMAISTRGDIIGGTQDQGSIKIEYNGITGNSGRNILSGDGFYCEVSRVNPDMYFFESQYGNLYRSFKAAVGDPERMEIPYKTQIDGGTSSQTYYEFNTPFRLWDRLETIQVLDTNGNPKDTQIHVSKFFFAAKDGVWMTPHATEESPDTFNWFKISKNLTQRIISMEYTSDGDAVYVGTRSGSGGSLYRITGLKDNELWFDANGNFVPDSFGITTEVIGSWSSRVVTGIGVSPSNNGVVVVTLGNYINNGEHVYISKNALDPAANVTWTSIHGNLPRTPAFDAVINSQSSNQDTIIVATELGIYSTTNGGSSWTEENDGIERAPVFMLQQMKKHPWSTGYTVFAASHGMGFFETNTLDTKAGLKDRERNYHTQMSVFPNPAVSQLNIKYILNQSSEVNGYIYNINGQIVKTFVLENNLKGENQSWIRVDDLKPGTYIIRLKGESVDISDRFLIAR